MSFWRRNAQTKIVVGATGKPVNCATCPCGGVVTDCCDNPAPTTLYLVLTKVSGDDNYNFTTPIVLVYNSATSKWVSTECFTDTDAGCSIRFYFSCFGGTWQLQDQSDSFLLSLSLDSCHPLQVTGSNQGIFGRANLLCTVEGGACGISNGNYDIAITETAP